MKKIVYFILFITLFLLSCNVNAEYSYYNTESNVKKAILVEDYIIRHKGKIQNFIKKYEIKKTSLLNKDIIELNESIEALKKIQNTSINRQKAEEVMSAIIIRVKKINENLKNKLQIEKNNFQKNLKSKLDAYSKLGIKLSNKINSINIKIATKIYEKDSVLTLKEGKIKKNLINLNKESLKLRNFGNTNFKSESEIKETFIGILKSIKKEIGEMKNTLR